MQIDVFSEPLMRRDIQKLMQNWRYCVKLEKQFLAFYFVRLKGQVKSVHVDFAVQVPKPI